MKHKIRTLSVLCLALLFLLTGCGDAEKAPTASETTAPTVPAPTTPADGDPDDVTCKGTYTASDYEVAAASDEIVATIGEAKLTIGQLQIYYWLEVAEFRMNGTQPEPDFTQSLDTQTCPLDDSVGSWQQYFLREALNAWHAQQALVLQGQDEGVPTEEEYQPDLEKHAEYLSDKPAAKYLYGHSESYQPNDLHQAYLDAIPQMLDALAADNGFADVNDQTAALAGAGANSQDLAAYTDLANRAYMYFTELGYHFEPTAEEVEAYYAANQSEIPSNGEKTVNIRHILLLPENATIAADGTVTADEDAWKRCLTQANSVVSSWQSAVKKTRFAQYAPVDVAESRFSEAAKNNSADYGSASNGGLYVNLQKGQLIDVLDAWCFDDARQHGDYEIIRSQCGYHILFFSASTEDWYAAAEDGLIRQMYSDLLTDAMEKYPMSVDYNAILLGQAEDNGSFVTPSDLLYPDVAHERYPSMPLYLQQDYPDAPYGDYKLSTHGCGITTLAMVASYLTDEELTPVELAAQYGYYCGLRGTEIVIFDDTPAEMGFQLKKRSGGWNEIQSAIEEGHIVVSLQYAGYWTSGGHYLAITGLTDDGKYVVRDSNLLNYKRISAHAEDAHTRGSITQAGQYYWIYEKKVTRIASCVRCSEDLTAGAPEILFNEDYLCAKCLSATQRRDAFLAGISG